MEHPDLARLAGRPRSRAADLIGEICSPTILVPMVMLVVTMRSASPAAALGWFALAALFCVVIPRGVLVLLVRAGVAADRHIVQREQRRVPLIVAGVSVVLGLALLSWLGAPWPLLALLLVSLAGLALTIVVSARFKISMHAMCAACSSGVLVVVFGAGALAALLLVPVVGWAGFERGDIRWPR